MPAAAVAWRILLDIGSLVKLDLHLGAAAEIHAEGNRAADLAPSAQPIEMMPATLKIIEKARKYHFFPSQSTFTP